VTLLISLVMLVFISGCASSVETQAPLAGRLSVQGSTALLPLVTAAAGLFERQNSRVHLDVKGGGSLFGLAAVTSHKSDIGDSDVYADPAAYPDPNLTDHIVCVIPFAMVVGPGVSVTKLTTQQIIDIFASGKIRNWKEVGGSDLPIVPVVRPATSGTRATFRRYILGGRDEIGTLLHTDSSTTVRDTVAHTPGAIGYLALSVLNASVRAIAINNYMPTPANIAAGNYSFWSYEHMYTLGDDNNVLSSFLDFMLTPAVQQLAQRLSYIPIARMKLPAVVEPAVPGTGRSKQALVGLG
jgi:phosphate transport system substrate-binding protein